MPGAGSSLWSVLVAWEAAGTGPVRSDRQQGGPSAGPFTMRSVVRKLPSVHIPTGRLLAGA
jgi:hypothetical protein